MTIRPVSILIDPATADPDGICAAQTLGGAGDLTINGVLASGGVATLPIAGHVAIASSGNLSSRTFTVYGTLRNGLETSEAIAGPNNSTVRTTKNFKTVTRVAVSGAVGTNVTVGSADSLEGPWIPIPRWDSDGSSFQIVKSSDANYTFDIETTNDNVFKVGEDGASAYAHSLDQTDLHKGLSNGPVAVRLKLTSFVAGTARFLVS